MSTPSRRPLLVTGSNRSGTTWVGQMLCQSRELAYVHEPFNPGIWPRWMAERVISRNQYVCAENEATFHASASAMIARRFPWRAQIRDVRRPKDAGRLLRETARRRTRRGDHRATLMKDPIAVFSSEWLAERFGMDVVMMVRSPVAFAGSVKRLGWAFDFGQWADQPLLMRDHLSEFADDIHTAAANPPGLVEQAVLTWNATYAYVDRMRHQHPTWHLVRYEDLAADAPAGFRSLYGRLGLHYSDRAHAAVERYSDSRNHPDVPSSEKGGIRRDSKAAISTWQTRLTPSEVELVDQGTRLVAARLEPRVGDAR